jgi:hypothetical protein
VGVLYGNATLRPELLLLLDKTFRPSELQAFVCVRMPTMFRGLLFLIASIVASFASLGASISLTSRSRRTADRQGQALP